MVKKDSNIWFRDPRKGTILQFLLGSHEPSLESSELYMKKISLVYKQNPSICHYYKIKTGL